MNTLHGESWKYSTRTVQSRGIKLCFTYNHLHTVSIYHVEAIRKWSYVNSKYCSHHQWKSVDYFLSFIATQKEKPLLLPNLSSFGWVCKRYCKLQYIEIMVEKKVRAIGSEIVVYGPPRPVNKYQKSKGWRRHWALHLPTDATTSESGGSKKSSVRALTTARRPFRWGFRPFDKRGLTGMPQYLDLECGYSCKRTCWKYYWGSLWGKIPSHRAD